MQPKLLRVLESQTVRRLGETEYRRVDVRFVSATNRDLQTMVGSGAFREDLFFRLSVLPAQLPPLRAHPEDIAPLLEHFFVKAPHIHLEAKMLQDLATHAWAGNVRELRAFAERVMTVGPKLAWELTRGVEASGVSRFPPPITSSPALSAPPVPSEALPP